MTLTSLRRCVWSWRRTDTRSRVLQTAKMDSALALGDKPDLLILDVMMAEPDDGIALAQDLRKADFKKPILMMSSISQASGLSYGRDDSITPVDEFVDKPVSPENLRAKVNALLGAAEEGTS